MRLGQTCLCAVQTRLRRLNLRGGAVKQLQACLSARKDRESSFLHCGSPGRLVQDCLCARNPDKSVLTSEEMQ